MHSFQPFPFEELDFNPFTRIGKDWFLLTCGDKQKANTMTASWGGVGVLWGKNVVFTFVRDTRYTKEFLDKNDFFTLSFMNESQHDVLSYLGSTSGRDEDKIANSGLTLDYFRGIPYIDESDLVMVCEKMSATRLTEESFINKKIMPKWYADNNMHTMYVGEIIQVLAR
ncbi:MAG: flavin reductase family protein [Lachnospiraceae bacterium]